MKTNETLSRAGQPVAVNYSDFTSALKGWRQIRKMSQLDLSLDAEVSQRHISWLETGRSKPSRDMIIRLSESLSIPNRDRNRLLNSAGFTAIYAQNELGEPTMKIVDQVLTKMLDNHNPYPAIVMDRLWNLKMKNQAADRMFMLLGNLQQVLTEIGDDGSFNIARLSVHPKGLRRFISNWDEIVLPFFTRLKREAEESFDPTVIAHVESLLPFIEQNPQESSANYYDATLTPILPLHYQIGDQSLRLVSVLSTFGSAQDVTTNELRIETFYPADDETAAYFKYS
ncbi:MAG: helix-turn-helix transcriptional regulator [Pseudomonadota bacterium]